MQWVKLSNKSWKGLSDCLCPDQSQLRVFNWGVLKWFNVKLKSPQGKRSRLMIFQCVITQMWKNCLVTSQFLRNTGVHFHLHSSQLPDLGWIWWLVSHVLFKMPLMWSYTLHSYCLCHVCEITNLSAPSLHADVWCDCGINLWFGTFAVLLMGKGSKISCAVDQLKSAARVHAPKHLQASQRTHTPSKSALLPHMCTTIISN